MYEEFNLYSRSNGMFLKPNISTSIAIADGSLAIKFHKIKN